MRDCKIRHKNAGMEYAGLENVRKGKVRNTASFLALLSEIVFASFAGNGGEMAHQAYLEFWST